MTSCRFTEKDIEQLRSGLDQLLSDCKWYMKRRDKCNYDLKCKNCHLASPYDLPYAEGCELFIVELQRLCKMLTGVGLSNRYRHKKSLLLTESK